MKVKEKFARKVAPCKRNSRWELFVREKLEDFGSVAFGFDGGPNSFDLAGFSDEEGTADDAHISAAHEFFLLPGAKLFDGLVIGVAEQREVELFLLFERGLGLDGVGAHPEDGHAELVESFFCVTKLGRFDDSTRGVGFGKEEE
jgi:hypothetical protein